jgi:translation initiation factor 2B subunit (eIF-2B alpha/beta/delta family)
VADDETHGSTWVAARALEVLRDAAAEADDWGRAAATARELAECRPSMAAVSNRVNRVMATADHTPESVRMRAVAVLRESFSKTDDAAAAAATRLEDAGATCVATLSRSGTVWTTLCEAGPERILVAESRPEREGVGVAERLASETDADVVLTTEAALPTALRERGVDAVVVGADAVLPDGSVLNKTGTMVLALAARSAGVPVYAVAGGDKVRPLGDTRVADERADPQTIYDGTAAVETFLPTFEATPATLFDGIATEEGLLDADGVRDVAATHAANARWDE